MLRHIVLSVVILLTISSPIHAADETEQNLASQTEALKAKVIELNRDLFLLQEDVLYPASSRVALYVSMDMGQLFTLDSVKVKLNGDPVSSFLYTQNDVKALKRGAIQPLYLGNIATGEHELVAVFTGLGPQNRAFKRAVTLNFTKESTEKAFEIQIKDDGSKQQPKFAIKPW